MRKKKGVKLMLYTPKYIYNNDLDKTICKCAECKKYRILYCHTDMIENKKESTKEMNSDIIAVCSKCGSTYRFNLKHISFKMEINMKLEEQLLQKKNILK